MRAATRGRRRQNRQSAMPRVSALLPLGMDRQRPLRRQRRHGHLRGLRSPLYRSIRVPRVLQPGALHRQFRGTLSPVGARVASGARGMA